MFGFFAKDNFSSVICCRVFELSSLIHGFLKGESLSNKSRPREKSFEEFASSLWNVLDPNNIDFVIELACIEEGVANSVGLIRVVAFFVTLLHKVFFDSSASPNSFRRSFLSCFCCL